MPVSISEQGACDTAATRVKACTKTASSSLRFAQEGTGGARFSETEGVKNPVEMLASVNADTWCKMEMFGSPSNSRIHSTQSLRAAKSFCHTGTFWKIPGVQQSKAKKKKKMPWIKMEASSTFLLLFGVHQRAEYLHRMGA